VIRAALVDAVLDDVDEDDEDEDKSTAHLLADLLDQHGAWDWDDGSEHAPSDRLAVVESSGAWWCVYRGTESDCAWRFASYEDANAVLREMLHGTSA
jgi:hypothetical protein